MSKRRLTAFRLELPYFWRGVFRLAKWLAVAALILLALNVVGYWCLQLEVYGPDMTAATRWPDNYAGRALKLTALGFIASIQFGGGAVLAVGAAVFAFHGIAWLGGYREEKNAVAGRAHLDRAGPAE